MRPIAIKTFTLAIFACTLVIASSCQRSHAQSVVPFDIDQFLTEVRSSKAVDCVAAIDRLGVASGIYQGAMFDVPPAVFLLTRKQLDRMLSEVTRCLSDADAEVRWRAITVLNGHDVHDDATGALVIKLLEQDPDEMVRVRAAIYCARLGWPTAIVPLLNATEDHSPSVRRWVTDGLHRLQRNEFVLDDEVAVSNILLKHLRGPASNVRYESARLLLAAMPGWYSHAIDSPECRELLSVWRSNQSELQRCLEKADAKTGVFVAAAVLRMDDDNKLALDYLRREIETLKSEYQNHGFDLGESFPLLGDDAKQLVPDAIVHATYFGSWKNPGFYGRQHLQQLGTIAVPFIAKELTKAELPDKHKLPDKHRALPRHDTIRFLSLLELMGKNAKLDGTDMTAALPIVKQLTKSADEATKAAALSTLEVIK